VLFRIWEQSCAEDFWSCAVNDRRLGITAVPALALQVVVTQVDKDTNGSVTYHFAVKTEQGETLTPGESKATADFVTVYNFYGLIDGSAKVPAGWEFSSEESGRTPAMGGYPLVLPLDVPNTPNLTWAVTKPVAAGVQIDGFTATTRVSGRCRVNTRRWSRARRLLSKVPPPERRVPRVWCPNRRSSARFRCRASSLT
jgi:hypothetical protein